MTKAIKVENLVKKYKKATTNAVDDLTFEVENGEFFAFLGPNGAGKTTTISILTTTLSKTSGKLEIAGFDIDKHPSEVRKNIGVIFQNPSLDLNLTAEENLRFHTILYGMFPFSPTYNSMPKEYKDKVNELSELLQIKNELFKPLKTFSGGMKRKLEIIRTMMHKPKVLFLDEPTSGLDPFSRRSLWNYIKDLKEKEGTTIFLTTHYLDEAEGADHVCIVNKGKIVINGTPKSVKESLLKEYIIVQPETIQTFTEELKQRQVSFEVEGQSVKIDTRKLNAWDFIRKIDSKVIDFKLSKPSLEEAYLSIVESQNERA